jgi:Spy/CpxP family protein refolding chaperone
MKTPMTRKHTSRRLIGPAVVALILMPIVLIGCSSSDGTSSDEYALTAATKTVNEFTEPLTINDIKTKLTLTSEQESQMIAALERFNLAIEERRLARENREPGTPPSEHPQPPGQTFLAECADFLDTEQLIGLVELMGERHEAARQRWSEAKRQGSGPGMQGRKMRGGGFVERWGDELNLTDEQIEQLEALQESMHEQMMAQRGQGNRGRGNRGDGNAFRDRMHEQLEQILTEEQLQRLEELREERQAERQESREERRELRAVQHLEFMSAMLKLTDAQKTEMEQLLNAAHDEFQHLHEQIANGTLERDDVRDQMAQIREQSHSAIRDLLTAEQTELFDALAELHPQRAPHGRHPF